MVGILGSLIRAGKGSWPRSVNADQRIGVGDWGRHGRPQI